MAVFHPRQTSHVEKVRRLVYDDPALVFMSRAIGQKSCMKIRQIFRIFRNRLYKSFILPIKMRIGRRNIIPLDQISLAVPTVFEFAAGIDHLGHYPNHRRIEFQTVLLHVLDQRSHVNFHGQAHDNAHFIDIKFEKCPPFPCTQIYLCIIHFIILIFIFIKKFPNENLLIREFYSSFPLTYSANS